VRPAVRSVPPGTAAFVSGAPPSLVHGDDRTAAVFPPPSPLARFPQRLMSCLMPAPSQATDLVVAFAGAVWGVLLELAPWLLLGAVVAGALHAWLPRGLVARHLGGRFGVLKAVTVGVPLPLCSCGVIPAGLGLRRQGASPGATVGFLVSTPQTGVDSVLVSASFLGWPFAVFKVVSALVLGLAGGLVTDAVHRPSEGDPGAAGAGATLESELAALPPGASLGQRLRAAWDHGVMLVRMIWRWLVFGVVASAALTTFLPADAFTGLAAYGSAVALGAVLAVSLPLYVCATASVPIAAALVAQGFPTGAALVFLMAGPATNVATVGAVGRAFGPRVLGVYLATLVLGSLGAGLLFDQLLAGAATGTAHVAGHQHGVAAGAPFWAVLPALLLVVGFIRFAIDDVRDALEARRRRAAPPSADACEIELGVDGMTCQGCARKVREAVGGLPGVEAVDVALDPGVVRVRGAVDPSRLRDAVHTAGFAARGGSA